ADGRLPVDGGLVCVDRGQVQRAAGTAGEAGSIEEDARAVDHSGVEARGIAEDAVAGRLGVMLETSGWQGGGERADHAGLVLVAEVGADRAAPVAQVLGRLGEDALTAATPDAPPVGGEECPVEAPDGVAGVDLLDQRVHTAGA